MRSRATIGPPVKRAFRWRTDSGQMHFMLTGQMNLSSFYFKHVVCSFLKLLVTCIYMMSTAHLYGIYLFMANLQI